MVVNFRNQLANDVLTRNDGEHPRHVSEQCFAEGSRA